MLRWSSACNLGRSRCSDARLELFFHVLVCALFWWQRTVRTHCSAEGASRGGWLLGRYWSSECKRKTKNGHFSGNDDDCRYRSNFNKDSILKPLQRKRLAKSLYFLFIASIFSRHYFLWGTCTCCSSFSAVVLNTGMFLVYLSSCHWTAIF